MQFQAELNLLDSFNESLRQVMDVESSIYNAKHAEERVLLQKEKLANEKMKKQIVALQSEREMELDKMEVESIDTGMFSSTFFSKLACSFFIYLQKWGNFRKFLLSYFNYYFLNILETST